MSDAPVEDDEAHLAALLAVLARTRVDGVRHSTPLQQWRARRLAALTSSTPNPNSARPSPRR
jgi:hypothetical protein